jgi:hypothetical protein
MKHLWVIPLSLSAFYHHHDLMMVCGVVFVIYELKDIYHVSN